jgi:hypothetical protein
MATINELAIKWLNDDKGHKPREAGRFYATDIYKIRQGYLKPKDFFTKKNIKGDTALELITKGVALEDFLIRLLTESKAKFQYHEKTEIDLGDFVISMEMDISLKDKVIECKYPRERCYMIPDRYIDQMTAYFMATKKDVYLCEFPFPVRLWKLEPDMKRWKENLGLLKVFNEQLKQL